MGYSGTCVLGSMFLLCTWKWRPPALPRVQAGKDLEGDPANAVCLPSACSFMGLYALEVFIIYI